MDLWLRLGRYVWPYRWSVVASFLIGLAVAAVWSAELLLTFPVIKVFLQGQTLPEYVRSEVVTTQKTLSRVAQDQSTLQQQLSLLPDSATRTSAQRKQHARLVSEQANLQRQATLANSHLAWMLWLEARVLPKLPRDQFKLLVYLFGLLWVATLIKGGLAFWQDTIAGGIGERAVVDLRQDFFRKVLRLDPQTVAAVGPASWTTYFTYHSQLIATGLNELSGRVIREPLKALACVTAALAINWRLTALSLCCVPLAFWLYRWLGHRLRSAMQRAMTSMTRIYHSLEEMFDNVRVVQLFSQAGHHRRRFHQQNRSFHKYSLKIVQLEAMSAPLLELLGMAAVLLAVLPGAYMVLRQTNVLLGITWTTSPMDIAELSVLYTLLAGTLDPVRKFTKFYNNMRRTGAVAEQIFEHMDLPTKVPDTARTAQRLRLEETIEFHDVSFAYATAGESTRPILDRVQLTLPAGKAIAIVGANGSGKSTLINLLPRFFDPIKGCVRLDGTNLREFRLRDLRNLLAWVPQETRLFQGTIADNIRYGKPGASEAEIEAAARLAHVLTFTAEWPEGLQTQVGAQGRALSGGQRQRIALARAFVKQPQLLILDEPASAVDAQSEQLIFESLRTFSQGRTLLLITHSFAPQVFDWIDQIVVLDRGRVVGQGALDDLAQTCVPFQRLLDGQSRRAA